MPMFRDCTWGGKYGLREGCSQMPISRDVPGNSAPDIKLTNGPQYIRESKIRLSRPPVNQMPMFRDCTWGGKYGLRKAVNQVNGARKSTRNGHNTGFLGMARPGSDGLG